MKKKYNRYESFDSWLKKENNGTMCINMRMLRMERDAGVVRVIHQRKKKNSKGQLPIRQYENY